MLTFGFEFECVAALSHQESQSDRTALEAIASSSRDLGFPVNVFLPRSTRDQPNYEVWNVCLDVTILEETSSTGSQKDDDKDLELVGAEIVSPIFKAEDDWQLMIERVFGLSGIGARIPLTTNRSTGFHVHVGIQGESVEGFTLEQVKSVAIAVMFFEGTLAILFQHWEIQELINRVEVIDPYHHASRSILTQDEDIASNRKNNLVRDRTDAQIIKIISAAETVMEVIAIVCYEAQKNYTGYGESKLFKVNFTSLSKCGTIEFRQHIATTDDKKLCRWIRFVILFVEMALITPLAIWESYLQKEKNPDLLFCKFLGNLEIQQEFEQ
ncbi:hypothetical protein MMC31_000084 [Peltigera leucophlebia]|nr:hypothetical protein [Peltigera leucophlebia]